MLSRLRNRSLRQLGETLPIALLTTAALLLAIAAAARDPGGQVHEAIMLKLRAVDVIHASLQRDVLRARAGILPSYDPLVSAVVDMRRTTAKLAELLSRPQFSGDLALQEHVRQLQQGIGIDEKLVEEFKTRNALLQNSLGVFGQTLSSLYERGDHVTRAVLARAGDLGNLMMRFSTRPDDELRDLIRGRLGQLPNYRAARQVSQEFDTVIVHAKMILAILPKVDAKIAAIQSSTTPLHVEQLQSEYLNVAADAAYRASVSRVVLGLTAIFLCVYVCFLVYRLHAQTMRLKRRLHYEQVIAGLKAQMLNQDRRNCAEFMNDALRTIASFFGADNCAFAVWNRDRSEFRDDHWLADKDHAKTVIAEWSRALLSRKDGVPPLLFWNNFDRLNPFRDGDLTEPPAAVTSHLYVGAALSEHEMATLQLIYSGWAPQIPPDELLLLQTTLQTMNEFIEMDRACKERAGLEQRLEHAQRLEAIGTLAGGMAHEFNNILGAILGYGEMAIQLMRKPSNPRHYVQEILKSGARAKHIVDQMLTFSRKRERIAKPFDVAHAIADIVPVLEVTVGSHVLIEAILPDTPTVVEGNPIEIQQLAMNLCRNASQASERGQKVAISVQPRQMPNKQVLSHGELAPGRYVSLSVKDEGRGIPEHILAHIFEPFFTTNAKTGGSGLGLAAVHGIISTLGGSIDVGSTMTAGTTFEVFIPASPRPARPINSFFDENAVKIGDGERVIIVEPDRTLRELYEEKVAALGYEAIGFENLGRLADSEEECDFAELIMISRNSFGGRAEAQKLANSPAKDRLLLLSDRDPERDPIVQQFKTKILKTPFSSASLASAIFHGLKHRAH